MEQKISHSENKKRRLWHAVMFYSLLLVLILGVLLLMRSATNPLTTWLEQYESAQYQKTADEVFALLFEEPDWALLYNMAGITDTELEGQTQFVAYMTDKIGDAPLRCTEIPNGLSSDHLYHIRHEGDTIASFTITPAENGGWTLGQVELYFTREQTVCVTILAGQTVYINKKPLDSSYTTLSVSTLAEQYLPEDVHGLRYQVQVVTGLLVQPEVTVLDTYGRPVALAENGENSFTVELPVSDPMTDEEAARILEAAKADALFSIRQISSTQLRQYFDTSAPAYKALTSTEVTPVSVASYTFPEDKLQILDFCRYSDTMFSVRVLLTLEITDDTGAAASLETELSYLFSQNNAGSYMVTQRLEENLQQPVTLARLRFLQDGTVLSSGMADTAADSFAVPALPGVTAWGKQEADGSLTPVLVLCEDGSFRLADGQTLEPMDLYPVKEAQ